MATRTGYVRGLVAVLAMCLSAAAQDPGPYQLGRFVHEPKPSRDIIDVGCQGIVPVQVPEVTSPSIFMNIQFRVAVPAGGHDLMVYVYDPTDYNANNFDVVVRYGEEVGFVEDPPGSGTGYVVYDWASFSAAAYEECPIFNADDSPIPAGDYYFALISRPGYPGGPVGMKACVDGVFRTLADGESRVKTMEAFVAAGTFDFGEQCVIDVPAAGVGNLLVTLEPAALATEFMLAARAGLPIGVDDQGYFPADVFILDSFGGYEEVCFTITGGGFPVYLEAFGLTAAAEEAMLTVRFNACFQELLIGDDNCIVKTLPGIYYNPAAPTNETPDAVQYRVTVTPDALAACGGGSLSVTVAEADAAPGAETVDFLLYGNPGAAVPISDATGLPDFGAAPDLIFRNATAGPGAETIVIGSGDLAAGDYWFLVSRDVAAANSPPVDVRLCAALTCGASFKRGFINDDDKVDIADAIGLLGYLFALGKEPACLDVCDINDEGKVDIADAIALLGYLFASRPAPSAPFEACGGDPTPDDVPCAASAPQCAGR